MIITHEFEFFTPSSMGEALDLLSRYKNKASLLAGGTDLVVNMKEDVQVPDFVIDIKGIDALHRLEFKDNSLYIGATVTFTELLDASIVKEKFPLIWESVKTVASVGIRNRATIVGNICSAVPSLDSGPALLVYEANVHIKSDKGEREIPISEWFMGPKKNALKPGELALGISIPFPDRKHSGCYVKLGRYRGEDLAQAGVAILALEPNIFKIAFCALGPVPLRAQRIESLLNGKRLTDSLIQKAQELIPEIISPITDIRATKDYRLYMTKIMLGRGLKAAVSRLQGNGPELGADLMGG